MESLLLVPVYDYVQDGDKMKKVRTGWSEIIPLPRFKGESRTIIGPAQSKCSICGKRLDCKLEPSFKDRCMQPKPVEKGTIIVNGCAVLIKQKAARPKERSADIDAGIQVLKTKNMKPVSTEVSDITESGVRVNLRVKVVRLWQPRSEKVAQLGLLGDETENIRFTVWASANQPPMKEGKCYRIRNAVTGYYNGYQVQINDNTLVQEINEPIKTKTEYIIVGTLSALRENEYLHETALKAPGIDEPGPKWEDYSATPFIQPGDDFSAWEQGEIEMAQEEIDTDTMGLALKKALKAILRWNPEKAKEAAVRLTPAQWQSLNKLGGLGKGFDGIHPMWEEPEKEGFLRPVQQGWAILTKKDKRVAVDMRERKRQEKFMINHGFRIKDHLEDLIIKDFEKAKAFAATLSPDDWMALYKIGGLNSQLFKQPSVSNQQSQMSGERVLKQWSDSGNGPVAGRSL